MPTTTRARADTVVPWALAAGTAAVYTLFAVLQWRLLESPSWDLGIFTQLAKAYAQPAAPVVTIKGEGFNLLGDHFHPLLVVLGPVYRLFPSGLTLLVLQALLLGLSVQPVTSVARELLGPARGTVLGVAYGLSWGLQGAVGAQFHEIALAVPLLAAALAAFLRGRWRAAALWAAPLVLVKEDLGLTVAALGAVMVWRAGRGRPGPESSPGTGHLRRVWRSTQGRTGALVLVWGVAWSVLAIGVVLPALNPGGTWDYYDRLDPAADASLLVRVLTPGEKWVTVLLLVGSAGVVGATSPLVWLWLPTLAWRFVGNVPFYWGWDWHYSAVLMPVAAAALLDVVAGRGDRTAGGPAPPDRTEPADRRAPPGTGAGGWATLGVVATTATTLLMTPVMPLGRLAEPATYALPERHDAAMAAIEAVPAGATVETDIYLMAYLVPRAQVYWVGNPGNPAPDYVQLDTLRRTWPDRDITDAASFAEERHPGTDYALVLDAGGFQVARRVG
ncbi:DUF2079 domain-containing protein [Georgenia muralis]|uniref:DUF2079 domain-containing protein n=1 Tax=Georgenia muralis TaxID=154117 RepID=UPI001FEA81DC|nr:DUF2079 domain-containing protein [Georgenia muralis]